MDGIADLTDSPEITCKSMNSFQKSLSKVKKNLKRVKKIKKERGISEAVEVASIEKPTLDLLNILSTKIAQSKSS